MQLVVEPEIGANRQRSNDPDQFVDDASADLLIDLLSDTVDCLVSRTTGDFLDLVMCQQDGLPALLVCHVVLLSAARASTS